MYGTKTVKAANTKELIHSIPNDRKILEFAINETFKLNLGNINLIVGRNECGICMNYPKCTRLNCGHSICNSCSELVDNCPYCRSYIDRNNTNFSQCNTNYHD